MEQLNPNEVYAESNIEQSTTNPVTQPDDLLGIRQSIYDELGVSNLQTEYNNLYKSYLDTEANRDTALNDLENKTLGMNVIRGSQAEANRQFSLQLGEQARGLDVAQRGLQSALTEAQAQYGIKAQEVMDRRSLILQNPGAGITFNDDINTIQQKLDTYQTKQQIDQLRLQYPGAEIDDNDDWDKALSKIEDYQKDQAEDEAFERIYGVRLSDRPRGTSKREWEKKWKKKLGKQQEYEDLKAQLEIEKLQADINNTNSLISNRGNSSGSSNDDMYAIANMANKVVQQGSFDGIPSQYIDDVMSVLTPEEIQAVQMKKQEQESRFNQDEQNYLQANGINPSNEQQALEFLYPKQAESKWWNPLTWGK